MQFNGVIEIYPRPTLVAMVTKIWDSSSNCEIIICTGCGKKSNPLSYLIKFLSNRSEFFDETLLLYSLFIVTCKCQISFNYLEIWQSCV